MYDNEGETRWIKFNDAKPDGSIFTFTESKIDETTKKTILGKTYTSRPEGLTKDIRMNVNACGKKFTNVRITFDTEKFNTLMESSKQYSYTELSEHLLKATIC